MRLNRALSHDMALWLYGLQSKMLDGWSGVDTPKTVTTTRAPAMLTTVTTQTGECIYFIVVTISLDS